MLLIYSAESTPMQERPAMSEWFDYTKSLRSAGALVAGDPLQPTTTATSVRLRTGERMITDGPFAETKEQLGGYYLIEAKDLDAALDWAAKCPGARVGTIEVRPVMAM